MKKFLKVLAWIIGVPLSIVLVFAILGFAAVEWNFWPPTCSVLPIPQAKRVCEFSKLDQARSGQAAVYTFWVTVPYTTPAGDTIRLAIDGKDPVAMEKRSATSFEKTVTLKTGDTLQYAYLRGGSGSTSEKKELAVRSVAKKIYDFVSKWSDGPAAPSLGSSVTGAVDMKDTWTINYNMNLFEDTRKNIDSSMARAVAMGDTEFGVYSFIDMAGDKDTFTVTATPSPYYHWRDAAITEGEMKTLERKAKAHGLTIVMHYNVGADYNKYYDINPLGAFSGGQAGSGIGGDAAERKAAADFGRNDPKTKAWIDRYFTQLQAVLVTWGAEAERAGIGAIDITPQYRPPSMAPEYAYADAKYRELIAALREVYHGKIYGSNFASFGGMQKGSIPQYIQDLDRLYVYVAPINVGAGAGVAAMRQAHAAWLDGVEADFRGYQKPLYLVMAESSYAGATSGKAGMEWGDWAEALAKGYKEDWQAQADSYEGFFEALSGRTRFAGVVSGFYWWDDLMAPKYMGTLNNMEASIRNKPAEAVWKKWFSGT